MTRGRILLGAGIVAALVLTAGGALAAGRGAGVGPGRADDAVLAACQAMHGSEEMQGFHARMPEDVRERIEAMHAQMGAMMAGAGSTMGPGMMGGTGSTMGPGMMGGTGSTMGPGMMGW